MVNPSTYPYAEYETDPLWQIVDTGIGDLVQNGDLAETTDRKYIVGYLCKLIRTTRAST